MKTDIVACLSLDSPNVVSAILEYAWLMTASDPRDSSGRGKKFVPSGGYNDGTGTTLGTREFHGTRGDRSLCTQRTINLVSFRVDEQTPPRRE